MPRREPETPGRTAAQAPEARLRAEPEEAIPDAVRGAFAELSGPLEVRPLSSGLLHRSLHVRSARGDFVLQRVSEVFSPAIHENIDVVSRHLAARGVPCPRLLPTRAGALFAALGEAGRWRLMPHLGGVSFDALQSPAQARSAATLVGRFHAALDDFDAPLAPMGIPFRDTPRYLAQLERAQSDRAGHRLAREVSAVAAAVRAGLDRLGPPPEAPERVIHGDLKISNLLFEGPEPPARDRALALIDLDTLMRAPLWSEWGDAWRSWCGVEEDVGKADRASESTGPRAGRGFDLEAFGASVEGFREGYGRPIPPAERASLVTATERLALELAVRFLTDALEERYFAWDPARHPSAGDHHLARARGQLALFEAAWACRAERATILESALR